jgi:hypothetical protein
MQNPLFAAFLVFALAAAGCQTPFHLSPAAAKRITMGTSRAEVQKKFGAPRSSETGPGGYTVDHYSSGEFVPSQEASLHNQRHTPGQLLVRSLSVLYDASGLVAKKLHDESLTDIRQEIGWIEIGPPLDDQATAQAQPQTSGEQLRRRLGEPLQRRLGPDGRIILVWLYLRDRGDRPTESDCRVLEVKLDEQNRVIESSLKEADMQQWFWALHALGTANLFSIITEHPNRPYIFRK